MKELPKITYLVDNTFNIMSGDLYLYYAIECVKFILSQYC